MPTSFAVVVGTVIAAFTLLLIPGVALLRLVVPAAQLGLVSRLAIAPGVTISFFVLLFTWADVVGLNVGTATPWFILGAALLSACVERRENRWRLSFPSVVGTWQTLRLRIKKIQSGEWIPAVALIGLLAVLLVARFHATWGWVVPPGIDSAQHAVIVQLLRDHRGLFELWAPYSDAQTFTYHFGFHAITAVLTSISGLDSASAVMAMARVAGVCAAASLVAMLRLWTRTLWSGVFAVLAWELYSRYLHFFDLPGRWTLLTGLAVIPAALVLLELVLRPSASAKDWKLLLVCSLTVGGLVLAQYKTAIIFVLLAGALCCSRSIAVLRGSGRPRLSGTGLLSVRIFIVVLLSFVLTAPRLKAVMETKTGRQLERIVLESPAASPAAYGAPTRTAGDLLRTAFDRPHKRVASVLALLAAVAIIWRRRDALWYPAGWLAVAIAMNPALVGLDRLGLIDEIHWGFAIQTGIATMAGLAVGLLYQGINRPTLGWNCVLLAVVVVLSGWALLRLPPVPQSSRFVLHEDVEMMSWIRTNVPTSDMIAARSFFDFGRVQGYDAAAWVPYFAGRQTNQTFLAALLERRPQGAQEKSRVFTAGLYARDMSTPESAEWMRDEGYRWFYIGAAEPERDRILQEQIARNAALKLVRAEGAARLYCVQNHFGQ